VGEIDNDERDAPQLEEGEELSNYISDSDVLANVLSRRSMVAYNYPTVVIVKYFFSKIGYSEPKLYLSMEI